MTGVIQPLDEICKLCEERDIRLHLDATQILGKGFFDLSERPIHLISFNGDQLHAPKGTGGLYIRDAVKCSPFIVGGIEQGGLRAGSYNVPGLAALGEAAREAIDSRDLMCTEVARLRDKLEEKLLKNIPDSLSFFADQERLPHCFSIAFPGVVNEALLFLLNRKGVYASIGGGAYQQIGLILMASGIPENIAHSALSFALSRETSEEDIDKTVEIVSESVLKLRKVSSQWVNKS
jgi:cysteine desulfurase